MTASPGQKFTCHYELSHLNKHAHLYIYTTDSNLTLETNISVSRERTKNRTKKSSLCGFKNYLWPSLYGINTHTHTHTHTHTCSNTSFSHTSELDLGLVVATDDGVRARCLTPVRTSVQRLGLRYLQLHLVVLQPHHRDVAGRNALAERRVRIAGVERGNYLYPLGAGVPGDHPLEILHDKSGRTNT